MNRTETTLMIRDFYSSMGEERNEECFESEILFDLAGIDSFSQQILRAIVEKRIDQRMPDCEWEKVLSFSDLYLVLENY